MTQLLLFCNRNTEAKGTSYKLTVKKAESQCHSHCVTALQH